MVLWDTVVGALLGKVAPEVAKYYQEKQQLQHARELEKIRGKIAYEEAKTKRASESEGRDHEWELESIRNSGWKDEWVLILLSIPLVLVFFPYTQDYILIGFQNLSQTPDWYQWLVLAIFTAIYGIRLWRRKM